jgi:hypothetical protein
MPRLRHYSDDGLISVNRRNSHNFTLEIVVGSDILLRHLNLVSWRVVVVVQYSIGRILTLHLQYLHCHSLQMLSGTILICGEGIEYPGTHQVMQCPCWSAQGQIYVRDNGVPDMDAVPALGRGACCICAPVNCPSETTERDECSIKVCKVESITYVKSQFKKSICTTPPFSQPPHPPCG